MEQPLEWNIFISYSHKDRRIVTPVTNLIRVTGVPVFRDEDSIKPGRKWALVISDSISACKTVLVFWSRAAADSKAVAEEYASGINLQKDIVPVLLDGTPLPETLKPYQWIDFRDVVSAAKTRSAWSPRNWLSGLAVWAVGNLVHFGGGSLITNVTGPDLRTAMTFEPEFSDAEKALIISALTNRILASEPG